MGNYRMNLSTGFLDLMARLGQAYDLKTVSEEMVRKRVQRTGDGTWVDHGKGASGDDNDEADDHHHHGDYVWGWGDKDMKEEDIVDVKHYNELKED